MSVESDKKVVEEKNEQLQNQIITQKTLVEELEKKLTQAKEELDMANVKTFMISK